LDFLIGSSYHVTLRITFRALALVRLSEIILDEKKCRSDCGASDGSCESASDCRAESALREGGRESVGDSRGESVVDTWAA
jgi:hypothetical protein